MASVNSLEGFARPMLVALQEHLIAAKYARDVINSRVGRSLVGQPEADVVVLDIEGDTGLPRHGGGIATAVRPQTTFVLAAEEERRAQGDLRGQGLSTRWNLWRGPFL